MLTKAAFSPIYWAVFACISCIFTSHAAPVASQYGQIQNVKNYSSNPFVNPNGSYNQGMPVGVNVRGPDLSSGNCIATVSALITAYCNARNNCSGLQITDIRPTIMVQLSQLPGHNYATSCSGSIDTEFDKYMQTYRAIDTTQRVAFPGGTQNNTIVTPTAFPAAPTPAANNQNTPQWKQEINERRNELHALQAENPTPELAYAEFPTTYKDMSFIDRMKNETQGYQPYEGAEVYQELNLESYEDTLHVHVTKPETTANNNDTTNPEQENTNTTAQTDPNEIIIQL